MRIILTLLCLSVLHLAKAQKLLKGVILDAEKNIPVPKGSVFLNNTSVGTTADEEGKFALYIPAGRFDLIVSSVGFNTHSQSITTTELPDFLTIRLQLKAPELDTVIIEPFEKNGWEKWGEWFKENFLGNSEYGLECHIKNPEVLKFRHSRKTNTLTVIAIAPLEIENKALGYKITYLLENFGYDFATRLLTYAGYPYFENMESNGGKMRRRWDKSRSDAYYGSFLHFMRALYRNRITEEGFEVRRLKKIPNVEKKRVNMLYKTSVKAGDGGRLISTINKDSAAYYNRIMNQDDPLNEISKYFLPGDSIAYAVNSTVAGLYFTDYLLIISSHKPVPRKYKQLFPMSSDVLVSEITLPTGRPVEILANGSYSQPESVVSSGYWGWWEKIGTMLPFDYNPPKK